MNPDLGHIIRNPDKPGSKTKAGEGHEQRGEDHDSPENQRAPIVKKSDQTTTPGYVIVVEKEGDCREFQTEQKAKRSKAADQQEIADPPPVERRFRCKAAVVQDCRSAVICG